VTSVSKQSLSGLKVSVSTDCMTYTDDNDNNYDDNNIDSSENIAELQLDGCYDVYGDSKLKS
jgi:hypothetical protein